MATWLEFCGLAGRFGGKQLGETAWVFELQSDGEGQLQRVFVFHELMKPDFEFIQVKSPVVPINEVDTEQVLKAFGQLNVAAIGYSPNFDAAGNPIDGFLTLSTSIPLAGLDLSDGTSFFLYLNVVARAAGDMARRIRG